MIKRLLDGFNYWELYKNLTKVVGENNIKFFLYEEFKVNHDNFLFNFSNYLKIDPNDLVQKIDNSRREYNYLFLDSLKEYNIPVEIYYQFFLSIEQFKLKNL